VEAGLGEGAPRPLVPLQRVQVNALDGSRDQSARLRSSIEDALKKAFRPEFLNRIDESIIFEPLSREQIHNIVDLMVKEMARRLTEHGVAISLTTAAKEWLAKEGFDPVYGARPLRRAVQRYVENQLSRLILGGQFKPGDQVLVDAADEGLTFSKATAAVGATA
jgi:ATP-dependent Clp protease ATP-binding subunit ClpC